MAAALMPSVRSLAPPQPCWPSDFASAYLRPRLRPRNFFQGYVRQIYQIYTLDQVYVNGQ